MRPARGTSRQQLPGMNAARLLPGPRDAQDVTTSQASPAGPAHGQATRPEPENGGPGAGQPDLSGGLEVAA
jgi:hypothetical protein